MHDDSLLPFELPAVRRGKVTAAFDGGWISSDGGLVLLRQANAALECKHFWQDVSGTSAIPVGSSMHGTA